MRTSRLSHDTSRITHLTSPSSSKSQSNSRSTRIAPPVPERSPTRGVTSFKGVVKGYVARGKGEVKAEYAEKIGEGDAEVGGVEVDIQTKKEEKPEDGGKEADKRGRKRKRDIPLAEADVLPTPTLTEEKPTITNGVDDKNPPTLTPLDSTPLPPPLPSLRPAHRAPSPTSGHLKTHPPTHYAAVLSALKRTRHRTPAPVDTDGCERLASPHAPPAVQRFQTLLALMLSSQTKDVITAAVMRRLQATFPSSPSSPSSPTSPTPTGLTPATLLTLPPATLADLLKPVGFYNVKASNVLRVARVCVDEHAGDIPASYAALVALPGVGPKMAHLTMQAAWGVTEGVGVDTHVARICAMWGWAGREAMGGGNGGETRGGGKAAAARSPVVVQAYLESWLPRAEWRGLNALLVGLGQTLCLSGPATRRRCGACDVGREGLCPGVNRTLVRREKRGVATKEGGREGREEGKGEELVDVEDLGWVEGEVRTEVGRGEGRKRRREMADGKEVLSVPSKRTLRSRRV
ncbi:MAG: DNA N-glycosylase and apurinic/apyrimidinic (AP) lyase [Piccolia ochrophora]|nr:MAG: DNA N-glycosylase and apurinic/apyrimidinic (AP) lyase [Piccolia ochrophora]